MTPPDFAQFADLFADLKAFDGDATDLARRATDACLALGISDPSNPLTERLVRDYAQRGILSRPDRVGKEARYRYQHLAELLAARMLVRDGWPLAKVAFRIQHSDLRDFLGPHAPPARTAAELAVQGIRRRLVADPRGVLDQAPRAAPRVTMRSMIEEDDPHQFQLAGQRADLFNILANIGGSNQPVFNDLTEIVIAPDIRLQISADRLARVTVDEAEQIGRAIATSLLTPPRKKKP
jgi:hypothetical protein